jgi:hypothetical protein
MFQYQVALSFAGEDRDYVDKVANYLKNNNISVFYDEFEEDKLWGKNLYDYLSDIYKNKARYTVMFISKHYKNKVWTNHERKSAQARALKNNKEYILPAKFDDTEIPGLDSTIHYINLKKLSPTDFAKKIINKLSVVEISLLNKDSLICYLPLKNDFNSFKDSTVIPIKNLNAQTFNSFDSLGYCINKENGFLLAFTNKIIEKYKSKTTTLWFRIKKHTKRAQFLFSLGKAEQNKAFGLYIGIPEIQKAHSIKLHKYDHSIRIFTYCDNKENIDMEECDHSIFKSEAYIKENVWYFISLVYSERSKSFKVYFASITDDSILESSNISKRVNVENTNYIFLGNMITEFPNLNLHDNVEYIALTYKKWILEEGYIREFLLFDEELSKSDIVKIFEITKQNL